MAKKAKKAKRKRKKGQMSKYNQTSYRYRQVYLVRTDTTAAPYNGIVNARINVWSMTNFYKSASGDSYDALDEPVLHQKNQYDFYRPSYIVLKYTPLSNQSGPLSPTYNNTAPVGYVCFDPDNFGEPKNVNSLISRDSTRQVNMNKPWTFKVKIPSMNSASIITKPGGWNNLQNEANNQAGLIWLFTSRPYIDSTGGRLPQATIVGDLMVTYYCGFKNRQYNTSQTLTFDPNIGQEEDGNTGAIPS